MVHEIKGNRKNPHFNGVGGKGDEDPQHDAKAMAYPQFGQQQGNPVQKLIVDYDGQSDDEHIDGNNGDHW